MTSSPGPAWYASGLRWIASGLLDFADSLDRRAREPWPLEPAPEYLPVDDYLLDVRQRASRPI